MRLRLFKHQSLKYNIMFLDKLVQLKDDAIDFISNKALNSTIKVSINPTKNFVIDKITHSEKGLFVNLNGKQVKIELLSRDNVIMIASYLDGSWDGLG